MTGTTGPVEMLGVSFPADVRFEGRIAGEIDKLEQAGLIQALDFLFLKRDRDSGELVRVDYDGEGLVARLIDGDGVDGTEPGGAHRLTGADIRAVTAALEPGASAAFMVFEHVWARGLTTAIAEVGGEPFVEAFLSPELVAGIGA